MTDSSGGTIRSQSDHLRGKSKEAILPLCVFALMAAFVLPIASEILWTSDDYVLVYGLDGRPIPTWSEALSQGGEGQVSAQRILGYPWNGYVARALGPSASHVLQVWLHLGCGAVVWWLLRKLRFSHETATWSVVFFLLSPWASQTLFWWCCNGGSIHSSLIILAGIVFLRSEDSSRPWLWITAACCLVFLALTLYELWLASWPMFVVVGWYRQRVLRGGPLIQWAQIQNAVVRALPLLLPFLVWGVWFKLSHSADAARNPVVVPSRMLIVFFSTQVRSLQLMFEISWKEAIENGLRVMAEHRILLAQAVALVGMIALWRYLSGRRPPSEADNDVAMQSASPMTRLIERLILAWIVLLSSRLVFMLQGGVAMWTRHNYGASIAWGIVFGAMVEFLQIRCSRRLVSAAAAAVVAVMGISMVGIADQYSDVSQLEERVFQEISAEVSTSAHRIDTVVVVGTPEPTWGEMGFYFERSGRWLHNRLRTKFPEINAYVVAADAEARSVLEERSSALGSGELIDSREGTFLLYGISDDGTLTRRSLEDLSNE
jgi:hypothetical protein